MLKIEITGTGNAGQIPLWGCHCQACARALADQQYRRRAATLAIHTDAGTTLLDAGLTDLAERYYFEQLKRVVLTHYHMDHVQGLFHLRWSERPEKLPLFGPDDPVGSDDLYKHPGVFTIQEPLRAFQTLACEGFSLTPVPLNHSRPTFGYLIQTTHQRIAYLTDTVGLPNDTRDFLATQQLDVLILDCSEPPRNTPPRNHNDLNMAIETHQSLNPKHTLLTHISHHFQCWLMDNALPAGIEVAEDGMLLE